MSLSSFIAVISNIFFRAVFCEFQAMHRWQISRQFLEKQSMRAKTGLSVLLPVTYSGLALPNTVNSATPNHQARNDVCSHLITALKDATTLRYLSISKPWQPAAKAATKRTILRSQETGKWLQTPPSYFNGTCLSDMKFSDALHLRYCRTRLRSYILHCSWP